MPEEYQNATFSTISSNEQEPMPEYRQSDDGITALIIIDRVEASQFNKMLRIL